MSIFRGRWLVVAVWISTAIAGFVMAEIARISTILQQTAGLYFEAVWILIIAIMIVASAKLLKPPSPSDRRIRRFQDNPHPYTLYDNSDEYY